MVQRAAQPWDTRVLVELAPGTTLGGKIALTLTPDTQVAQQAPNGLQTLPPTDLAVGQTVQVSDTGAVTESYPAQATAHRIMMVPPATTVPDDRGAAIPQRAPDVTMTITQANNTLWIDDRTVAIFRASSRVYRRSGSTVDLVDIAAVSLG